MIKKTSHELYLDRINSALSGFTDNERSQYLKHIQSKKLTKLPERVFQAVLSDVLLSTIDHHSDIEVIDYCGVVTSRVSYGFNIIKDQFTKLRSYFGGRSGFIEGSFKDAHRTCLIELREQAKTLGANAVIGININENVVGESGDKMINVLGSGTAIICKKLS